MVFTKVKRVKTILLIPFFLFFSVALSCQEPGPVYLKYVNEVTSAVIKDIQKELGITFSSKGGSMPHDVSKIDLHFITKRQVSIEEARRLLVIANEKLLKTINEHEKIRPYLHEYPFKANRATISIAFVNEHGLHQTEGVAFVFQVKGTIVYREQVGDEVLFRPLMEEPYDGAVRMVETSLRLLNKT